MTIVALCYAPFHAPARCLISLKLKALAAPYIGVFASFATACMGVDKVPFL